MWASAAVKRTARAAGNHRGEPPGPTEPRVVVSRSVGRRIGPDRTPAASRRVKVTDGLRGDRRGLAPGCRGQPGYAGTESRGEAPHHAEPEAPVEERAVERPAQRGSDLSAGVDEADGRAGADGPEALRGEDDLHRDRGGHAGADHERGADGDPRVGVTSKMTKPARASRHPTSMTGRRAVSRSERMPKRGEKSMRPVTTMPVDRPAPTTPKPWTCRR